MTDILSLRALLEPHDLTFFAGAPYVYHCHHYNLFHDQTVDDVLGEERGLEVRKNAAHSAFGAFLERIFAKADASTIVEKVQLAQGLISAMGHGGLEIDLESGKATGNFLHYGFAWSEKYGSKVKRFEPADGFAAGCIAAISSLARHGRLGACDVQELACIAQRQERCEFSIEDKNVDLPPAIDSVGYLTHLGDSEGGIWEEEISAIAKGLQDFVKGVAGDERGLVNAFGVFVTMHFANYYNETAITAVLEAEEKRPSSATAVEGLFREAGHVCVFNTFGNILLSPEWEALVGPLVGEPDEIIRACAAMARGLGFGRWSVAEFEANRRLVLRSTSLYEGPWYLARHGKSDKPRAYIFQGAALAFMVLAHNVKWSERPSLTQTFYDSLFRKGLGFKATPTKCVTMGDAYSEVIVEATS